MRCAALLTTAVIGLMAVGGLLASPAAAATSAYAQAVLADHPSAYYRLDESAGPIAPDASGNGRDATYLSGVTFGAAGALVSEGDAAIATTVRGAVVNQSGDALPAANTPRTLEIWVQYACCNGAIDLMRYGDVAGGHGVELVLGDNADTISLTAGGGSVAAPLVGDYRHGWHLIDATYDGTTASIYQDGQLIGAGTFGAALATVTPGQGLQLGSNASGAGLDEAAVYPTALSADQVDAHWTAAQSTPAITPCTTVPHNAPYPAEVLADGPLLAFRLDELALSAQGRVAIDYSSHCRNGAYHHGAATTAGAVTGDGDPGVAAGAGDVVLTQSGAGLPAGSAARTLEAWVRYVCCNSAYDLLRYGDVSGGQGFEVAIGNNAGKLSVTAGASTVNATPVGDFAHGYHMVDVTYDGNAVVIYQDGQVIGGGTLGTITTAVPGQGLRVAANAPAAGLDEVAVYGAALSAQRILAHFQASTHAPAVLPANTAAPTISGTPAVGSTLTEANGTWDHAPTSFAFQWQDCDAAGGNCADISGATAQTYTVAASDAGHTIRVEEFATNAAGTAGPAASSATAGVPGPPGGGGGGGTVTVAQIKAALAPILRPRRGTRIRGLLKTGRTRLSFAAPGAGLLVVRWFYVPKGAHLAAAKRPKPVLVAQGRRVIPARGTVTVTVRLTSRGRALLRHARRIKLTSKAGFTVAGKPAVVLRRTFTLSR